MYVCVARKQLFLCVCFKPNQFIWYAFISKLLQVVNHGSNFFLPFTIYDIKNSFIDPSSFLSSNLHLLNISLSGRRWIIISKRLPGTPWADPQNILFEERHSGSMRSLSVITQVVVLCIILWSFVWLTFGLIAMSLKSERCGVTLQLTPSQETYSCKLCIRVTWQKCKKGEHSTTWQDPSDPAYLDLNWASETHR